MKIFSKSCEIAKTQSKLLHLRNKIEVSEVFPNGKTDQYKTCNPLKELCISKKPVTIDVKK